MSKRVNAMARRSPLITDRKLPDRLLSIIETQPAIANDDDQLIEQLRAKFPEYRRKTISALQSLLAWARPFLAGRADEFANGKKRRREEGGGANDSDVHDVEADDAAISDSDNDVEVIEKDAPSANIANSSIRSLYKTPSKPANEGNPTTAQPLRTANTSNPAQPQKPSSGITNIGSANPVRRKRARLQSSLAAAVGSSFGDNSGENWQPEFTVSQTKYADLGGIASILQDVRELIEYPLSHPELYSHLGVDPPRGVLLYGPPGAGKTALAHAIAGELAQFGVKFLAISAPEIVSGMSGESEAKIRALFQLARNSAPCLIFIDEIDAITPKRAEAQREMERRIVAQMLTAMDTLAPRKKAVDGDNDNDSNEIDGDDSSGGSNGMVIVIGATNRPDSLDPALRRAGRFDREIAVPIPDEAAREQILRVMSRGMRTEHSMDWRMIAAKAVGYVGADLAALTREAAVIAVNRIFRSRPLLLSSPPPSSVTVTVAESVKVSDDDKMEASAIIGGVDHITIDEEKSVTLSTATTLTSTSTTVVAAADVTIVRPSRQSLHLAELEHRSNASLRLRAQLSPLTSTELSDLFIEQSDFVGALTKVQPSSKREGFASVPDVSWNDVGALSALREELTMHVLQPIKNPAQFEALGLQVPAGVLLFGPPGCGKTLVAKAIANESGASFLSVKGPELLNAFVGQSERAVRRVFERARASSPCVIFFDELDALAPKRGSGGNSSEGSHVSERVVNQLLTELDGLEERKQVFVLAATNRPDIIDPAMLRPGRLEKLLYVPLPTNADRASIIEKQLLRTPLETSDKSDKLALVQRIAFDSRCERFSGADCAALVREAAIQALKEVQAQSMANNDSDDSGVPRVLDVKVSWRHFDCALNRVLPSVSREAERRYDAMKSTLRKARATIEAKPDVAEAGDR